MYVHVINKLDVQQQWLVSWQQRKYAWFSSPGQLFDMSCTRPIIKPPADNTYLQTIRCITATFNIKRVQAKCKTATSDTMVTVDFGMIVIKGMQETQYF